MRTTTHYIIFLLLTLLRNKTKKIIFLFILFVQFCYTESSCQTFWHCSFDSGPLEYLDKIFIDSSATNQWQIGQPNKSLFITASSTPNAIITDTISPVQANDTSVFYLYHYIDSSQVKHFLTLYFTYMLDGDSSDFGTVEISPDGGNTWINMIDEDSIYHFFSSGLNPLSGSSNGIWFQFFADMSLWASYPILGGGPFPQLISSDTLIFRFTYFTDNNPLPKDGWMIDDIEIFDVNTLQGLKKYSIEKFNIFPNPGNERICFYRDDNIKIRKVILYNSMGEIVYNEMQNSTCVNTKDFFSGIYLLVLEDANSRWSSIVYIVH